MLVLQLMAGLLLGFVFFVGLWLTVQRMPGAKRPALLFVSSVVVRMAVVLAGIWYLAGRDPLAIAACLAGFAAARLLVTRGVAADDGMFGRRSVR